MSVAGKGAGLAGERSGLWREMHRVISEVLPPWVVVENVPALVGRGLRQVISDLASLGYVVEWQLLSALGVGAYHIRQRICILAHFDAASRLSHQSLVRDLFYANRTSQWAAEPVPRTIGREVPPALRRAQLRALGNAVVPQWAEVIGRLIRSEVGTPPRKLLGRLDNVQKLPGCGELRGGLVLETHPLDTLALAKRRNMDLPGPLCSDSVSSSHLVQKAYESGIMPTPTAQDGASSGSRVLPGSGAKPGVSLTDVVVRHGIVPTPSACEYGNNQGGNNPGGPVRHSLSALVQKGLLPTPRASDWRSGKITQATADKNSRPLCEVVGGHLSPAWVSWLMGLPTDYLEE